MMYDQTYKERKNMALGDITGVKTQISQIKTSGDCGSRNGRIEVLKQVSELGKEILDALNVKDETLVDLEGDFDDILSEVEDLDAEIQAAEETANGLTGDIEDIDAEIAAFEERIANGEELSEFDQARLDYLYQARSGKQTDANDATGKIGDLTQQRSGFSAKLDNYNTLLNDIAETMDDYADAGDEVRQAAHDVGRPGMADNIEKDGGAIKRNESAWGCDKGGLFDQLTGGMITAFQLAQGGNDTEQSIARQGLRGMQDGGNGYNMTYHDDTNGGYHAAYDEIQYGIGGELRQLTAQTLSYGRTVNTAANDMKQRAEAYDDKRKLPEEDEGVNGGGSTGTA